MTSEGKGILKTITIEITEEVVESSESSARSSVVSKEWEEELQSKADEDLSGLMSLIIEQGRLAKAKRRSC